MLGAGAFFVLKGSFSTAYLDLRSNIRDRDEGDPADEGDGIEPLFKRLERGGRERFHDAAEGADDRLHVLRLLEPVFVLGGDPNAVEQRHERRLRQHPVFRPLVLRRELGGTYRNPSR